MTLAQAVRAYVDDPSDENARAVAALADRASDQILASACRTLMRTRILGPHDIADAFCAAMVRAAPSIAKTGDIIDRAQRARGGGDGE